MKKINTKKLKYGSVAIAFTAIFVSVIVLFNVIISVVNKNGLLDVDVTSEGIFTVSDQSLELLKNNNTPLTIYFLRERDEISEDNESYMLNLVDSYTSNFSWIDVEYIDLDRNPKFKDKYTKSSEETLSNTSLIVECSATAEYRILTVEDYFLLEQSYYYQMYLTGFQGELALTSAILNVLTPDELVAAFETGHNELSATALKSFLENVGYEVRNINLREEEIDDSISLLVINNPKQDFSGNFEGTQTGKSEIEKLVEYIEAPDKNMLVFMAPDSPKLKEFEEFLAVYGVAVERNVIVDEDNSVSGSLGLGVYGIYPESGENEEVDLITEKVNSEYKTVFNRTAPITILFGFKNGIYVHPIVTTSKTAYYNDGDNKVDGQFNMMTLTTKGTSKLVVCSTNYYNTFIETTSYANRDLLYSIAESFGAKNVTPDIPIKVLDETKAQFDISSKATRAWGIAITAIPAAIVLLIGIVVTTKRRHL